MHFKENAGQFTKAWFPSIYQYVTSAWRFIKKYRWRTISLIVSANYEGQTFADLMLHLGLQELWEILPVVWLLDETIENGTSTELKKAIKLNSDVVVMHSRLSHMERFFELVQEVGANKHKAVWIVTEITTHLIKDSHYLPEGLLKIKLKVPHRFYDDPVHENALQDALTLLHMAFEETIEDAYKNNDGKSCEPRIPRTKLWKIAKR